MPGVTELTANLTHFIAQVLVTNLQAMPPDRQTWKPMETGRSALDQIQECAIINGMMAESVRTGQIGKMDFDLYERQKAELDTAEKAIARLLENTAKLTAAIRAYPADRLDEMVTLPFGSGMTMSAAEYLMMAFRNMNYHFGQISYIQTLYGDDKMHLF